MAGVTFIVPVFNKSKYLKYVLDSFQKQEGSFDREYIFINDGSTDDSYEILKENNKKGL